VNKKHKLETIVSHAQLDVLHEAGTMTILLNSLYAPWFSLPEMPDSYYYEMYILFIDEDKQTIGTENIVTDWVMLNEPKLKFEMSFEIPVRTKYFVAMLKVQGGMYEIEIEDFRSVGMRVMKVEEV
jgi:hypothetical protein